MLRRSIHDVTCCMQVASGVLQARQHRQRWEMLQCCRYSNSFCIPAVALEPVCHSNRPMPTTTHTDSMPLICWQLAKAVPILVNYAPGKLSQQSKVLVVCSIHYQVDSGTWSAPDILPGSSPGPRAFHSAVSLECSCMLLFGGHILSFDAEHNRKKRNFFNDMWQLDLVRPF